MFRSIITKLSGFTAASSELPVQEIACRVASLSPSTSPRKISKRTHRRSCSHPAAKPSTTNYHIRSQALVRRGYVQNTCSHHNYIGGKKDKLDLKTHDSKSKTSIEDAKPYEYESSDQYELEAARPRKDARDFLFNVREYLDKIDKGQQDLLYHLQPSQLTPFGEKENPYIIHTIRNNKTINIKLPTDISIQLELSRGVTDFKNTDEYHLREDLTEHRRARNASNIHKLLDKLPSGKEALELQPEDYKYQQLGVVDTAKKCKQKLIESHVHPELTSKEGKMDLTERSKTTKNRMTFRTPLGFSYADNIKQNNSYNSLASIDEYSDQSECILNSNVQSPSQKVLRQHSVMSKDRSNLGNSRYTSNKSYSSTVIRNSDPATMLEAYLDSKNTRPYEPKSCVPEPEPNKCFLPSKLRLKPPPCTPKPPPCPPKKECPRADDCLEIKEQKLPIMEAKKCPCVEDIQPTVNPRLKRLKLDFKDPPRVCPCNPCPCPPRADDNLPVAPKELKPYKPKSCDCISPPPMVDVPLKRLKKVCEPEDVCYPPKPCPKPEPCIRADDCWELEKKPLPPMIARECPCVEPPPLKESLKLKRLDLHVPEPERICPPPKDCSCNIRADGCVVVAPKKLPSLKPKDCPCVDMPLTDAPRLKRLVCVDDQIHECYASDPCITTPRADMGCWEYYVAPAEKKKEKKKKTKICSTRQEFSTLKPDYEDIFFNNITIKPENVHALRKAPPISNFKEGAYFQEGSYINVDMRHGKGNQKYDLPSKKNKTSKPVKPTSDCRGPCYLPKYDHCMSTPCESNRCTERIPVCCEKQASPYPAYSEKINPEEVAFDRKSHCTTCSQKYGFKPTKDKKLCQVPEQGNIRQEKKHYGTLVHAYVTQSKYGGKLPSRETSRQPAVLEIPEYKFIRSAPKCLVTINPDPITPRWIKYYSYHNSPFDYNKNKNKPKKFSHKLPLPPPPEPPAAPKPKAPFPAFTECLDTELSENLSQCPLDKCKLDNLQPHSMHSVQVDKRVLEPIVPNIQTVDTQIEEDCVRNKLGMGKRTVTQHCEDFGKPIKPMRAKDYIKVPRHRDCGRIDQLKKEGRWPLKHLRPVRKFCTTSKHCRNIQFRYFTRCSLTTSKASGNKYDQGYPKNYSLKRVFGETFLPTIDSKSFSKSTKSQTCLAKKLKKLNRRSSKLKHLELADKSLQPKYPILPEIGSNSTNAFSDCHKIDRSLNEAYLRHKFGVKNDGVTLDCSNFGYTDKNISELFVNDHKKVSSSTVYNMKTCKSEGDITSKSSLNQCNSTPLIMGKQTISQQKWAKQLLIEIFTNVMNYFKPRPNCPPPEAWKKKRLRERANKAAKAAGLVVCDPNDIPANFTGWNKLPNIVTPQGNETKSNKAGKSCKSSEQSEHQQSDNTVGEAKCSSFDPLSFSSRFLNGIGSSTSISECTKLLWMPTLGDTNKQFYGALKSSSQLNIYRVVNLTSQRYYSKNSGMYNANMNTDSMENTKEEICNKNTAVEQDNHETEYELIQNPRAGISIEPTKNESNDTTENHEDIFNMYRQLNQLQDYLDKMEAFKDLTFEEFELAKTKQVLWELGRILDELKRN